MIPLPLVAISNISFRLKIIASQAAVLLVNIIGMPVTREGSVIKTAHSYLVVEDPCSGIRSLIALIALGCLMAYLSKSVRWKKAILFLSSIPIAIFANVIRIVMLTLVSEMYGTQFATGMFHDIMGFVVFVIAFACLKLVYRLIE
jgi:exosortase